MDRNEKQEFVTSMKSSLDGAGSIIVAHYAGLTVSDMMSLRSTMREAGGSVKVAKNRLMRLALSGMDIEHMTPLFEGQTLIAWSSDPIVAPKVAVNFSKENENLVVLGGAMGSTPLAVQDITRLASLPSLDELRGKLIGMITTPATRIAMLTRAPTEGVARVIGAYSRAA